MVDFDEPRVGVAHSHGLGRNFARGFELRDKQANVLVGLTGNAGRNNRVHLAFRPSYRALTDGYLLGKRALRNVYVERAAGKPCTGFDCGKSEYRLRHVYTPLGVVEQWRECLVHHFREIGVTIILAYRYAVLISVPANSKRHFQSLPRRFPKRDQSRAG